MADRIKALKDLMIKNHLDGYLVSDEANMFYLTGVVGATVLYIPVEGENLLHSYSTNYEAVKATAENCHVERLKRSEDSYRKLAQKIKEHGFKRIGFDYLGVSSYLAMKKALKGIRIKPSSKLVQGLRAIKSSTELASIRKAAEITDAGVRAALEIIKPGVREYEIAAEMECAMRKLGSEGIAFDTIVASGTRSALPHAGASGQSLLQSGCTDRKVKEGEFIVMDLGARYSNYKADITRTCMVGKPTPKQKKMFEVVREAQQKAFEKIQAGVRNSDVDAVARRVIEKAGFGQYFVHGLGHGVGLEVHEAPTLNAESKERLEAGNVVTDEPGIYIVGYGGVRIEDTVLVQKSKAEKLTKATYDLTI